MPSYNIKWSVTEIVNGPGQHDDGVRDGDKRHVADGEVIKEGESADALRAELTAALERGFPRVGLGPTYNLDRTYNIEITEVVPAQ